MDDLIGKSITIRGKVQGVFYRASTLSKAQDLGLKGWVRNGSDGGVKVEVYGAATAVAALIVWCSKGSEFSIVETVSATDIPYKELESFIIKY